MLFYILFYFCVCLCVCYRDTKTKVLNVGSTVAGFAGMYYEEHLKPVTDPYMEWAKDRASSLWERAKNRMPTFRSTQDQ